MVEQQEDRADQGAGGKDRVLERAEPEHPDPCLVPRDAEILERLDVHREPAAGDEHPEPGGDDRARPQRAELDAASDVGDLAVGERVADVGGHGTGHRERDPVPVRVPQTGGDGHVARRARDEDRRDQRERGRDHHDHHDVVRLVLAVMGEQHLEGAAPPHAQSGLLGHSLLVPTGDTRDAPGRIRTSDPRIRSPPLCPLSYGRVGKG